MLCYMRKIRSLHTSTTGRTNYFKVFVQFKFKNSIYAFCVVFFFLWFYSKQIKETKMALRMKKKKEIKL